jgi:hypothetical protein
MRRRVKVAALIDEIDAFRRVSHPHVIQLRDRPALARVRRANGRIRNWLGPFDLQRS